jgi:hypothetical protein
VCLLCSEGLFALLGAFLVILQVFGGTLTLCILRCSLRPALHLGQACPPLLGTILPITDRFFALLGAFLVILQVFWGTLTLHSLRCPLRPALHLGQACPPLLGAIHPITDRFFALLGAFLVILQVFGGTLTLCILRCSLRPALHLGQACPPLLGTILPISDRFFCPFGRFFGVYSLSWGS